MRPRDGAALWDIIAAGRLATSFIHGVSRDSFLDDLLIQSAVIRQIEVMGEATKRLSEEFRAETSKIPWRKIAGMRDLLIHAYDHVDPEEVWNVLQTSIPSLVVQLNDLLNEE
jgi:uncharacterized protein with HEPN domain